jgi:hypothetical protein
VNPNRPSVDLHIERLVLDGFAEVDRAGLGVAVQAELARLLTERGVPTSLAAGGHAERVEGGRIAASPGASAALGTQIAHAVYRGLQP